MDLLVKRDTVNSRPAYSVKTDNGLPELITPGHSFYSLIAKLCEYEEAAHSFSLLKPQFKLGDTAWFAEYCEKKVWKCSISGIHFYTCDGTPYIEYDYILVDEANEMVITTDEFNDSDVGVDFFLTEDAAKLALGTFPTRSEALEATRLLK